MSDAFTPSPAPSAVRDVATSKSPSDVMVTTVDGEVVGTKDDLADVVESIVTDQVALLMSKR